MKLEFFNSYLQLVTPSTGELPTHGISIHHGRNECSYHTDLSDSKYYK